MIISQNFPLTAGQKLQDAKWTNLSFVVAGVMVDNGNSTTDVYVYEGNAPNGIPYIVKAGWCRAFPLGALRNSVYITFPNVPSVAGQIQIVVSSESLVAFSSQVANVTVTNPVTVNGTVGVNNFPATQSVQAISDYPVGAIPWATQILAVAINSAITVFSGTQPLGTKLYLGHIRFNGLNYQATSWALAIGGVFNVFTALPGGIGDVNETYTPPIAVAQWTSAGVGSILLQTGDTLIGTVLVWGFATGYTL